jgi:hypothetical protein
MSETNNNEKKEKMYVHPTRIFKTAEELLAAWNEYKKAVDEEAKRWAKIQYVGKDGHRVVDYPPMPYDLDGFCAWYFNKYGKFITQYFERTHLYEDEFLGIVTHIKNERNASIKTGTLLGFYNASMGNRIVGLTDKQENINKNEHVIKEVSVTIHKKQDEAGNTGDNSIREEP